MKVTSRPIVSNIASSTADDITVRGYDLSRDLLGSVDIGGMAFLELVGRIPSKSESVVFNSLVVAVVEHGITPSVLAARLTLLGAPDALQGAVAAGLNGIGSAFLGTIEDSAKMLQEALFNSESQTDLSRLAHEIVAEYRDKGAHIPGLGHHVHKGADPRTARLLEIARENDMSGQHVTLLDHVAEVARVEYGRLLPVNATGAIGAIASELGIPWQICRGIGLIGRTIGLVGHLLEEMDMPMAPTIWHRIEAEVNNGRAPAEARVSP